ncbi:hypothetical protein O3P69_002064 [Scylla paramamosain]|uniref:Uncharacterized protein n=1 Tax=Scylla paramamosain TaxID=85552 RepID=A0AAW0V4J6_SCYPA
MEVRTRVSHGSHEGQSGYEAGPEAAAKAAEEEEPANKGRCIHAAPEKKDSQRRETKRRYRDAISLAFCSIPSVFTE